MHPDRLETSRENEKAELLKQFLDKYFAPATAAEERSAGSIGRQELEPLLERGLIMDEILQAVVRRGYVLHGSSFDIKELEPRTAVGQGAAHERLTAIYCTDFAPTALFNAITPKASAEEAFHTCWDIKGADADHVDSMTFGASRNILDKFSDGFVYVLSREHVKPTPSAGEFVSEQNYPPVAKILIKRQDFRHEIEECSADRHNKDGSYKE